MTITDLYPQIQALQHADKLRLMQFLITEFARDEHINLETTHITPTENIDALKAIANMAQPLGACPRISLSNEQPLFDSEKF
jgi:hypothetical protein